MAGGRYDSLAQTMGGVDTPGIGYVLSEKNRVINKRWAAGVERLVMMLDADLLPNAPVKFAVAAVRDGDMGTSMEALKLTENLRSLGFQTDYHFEGSITKQLKKVSDVDYVFIIGENELKNGTIVVRNMKASEQTTIPRDQLVTYCKNINK